MNGFIDPNKLWLILLVILCSLLAIYLFKLRSQAELILKIKANSIARFRYIFILLLFFVLSIAVARPYFGTEVIKVFTQGQDIMLLVDTSLSMQAKDLPPSRLEVAKRKIFDLLTLLRKQSANYRVGIILFSGESYLFCPLTTDYSAVQLFASNISNDLISWQGSDLAGALKEAFASFNRSTAQKPTLIVLSDGEDLKIDPDSIIKDANGIKISSIGLGQEAGAPIPTKDGRFIKNQNGELVISKLNDSALKKLAEASAGIYVKATVSSDDLNLILSNIAPKMNQGVREETITLYNEIGPKIVTIILFIILLSLAFAKRYAALFILLFFVPTAFADSGSEAYAKGEYDKALKYFTEALELNPNDQKLLQSQASSYYKLGKYSEAAQAFSKLNEISNDARRKFIANYNLGNTLLMQKKYEAAIKSYEEALKIKADDYATKFNLELAKKLMNEKSEQEKNKEQNKENKDKENKEQPENDKQQEDQKANQESGSSSSSSSSDDSQSSSSEDSKNSDANSSDSSSSSSSNSAQSSSMDQSSSSQDGSGNDASQSQEPQNQQQDNQDKNATNETDQAQASEETDSSSEAQALPLSEAEKWLQSLPEAPALLQTKKQRGAPRNEQFW